MTSPGEYQADSPKCVIKVPTAQLPKQRQHPTQEPRVSTVVDQKDKKPEVTDKLSTRASSFTRPRAVLSSPDNDEMIGSENSKRVIQTSPLRRHTVQKLHMEHKVIPLQTTAESPVDNDEMTGSKSSKRVIQPSPLGNHNMVQKRHVEHKIIPSHTAAEGPIDNDEMIKSKSSKRVIQPSPLRNHNMVQKRHVEHKIIPLHTETPTSTRRKPAYAVNNHTPSTTAKGKPKTANDQSLTKGKQSGSVASSQKALLKNHKANSIV